MKFISVSDLSHRATKIISEIEATGEVTIVTRNGQPKVLMRLVSKSDFGSNETKKKGKEMKSHGKRNLQKR